jgi:conjugal transfer pilus assembly protein TraB
MRFLENAKRKRQILIILAAVGGIALLTFLLSSHRSKPPIKTQNPWESENGEGLWKQKWMVAAQTKLESQEEKLKALEAKQEKTQKTLQEILKELKELREQKTEKPPAVKSVKTEASFKNPPLPSAVKPYIPPPKNFRPEVINDVLEVKTFKRVNKTSEVSENATEVNIVIPPGTFVPAVLLSGVDAPTMGEGVAKEYPVLLEITDMAFLPNNWREDIRKCFAVGWAKGDLASERAYIRIDRMSCVSKNGKVYVAEGSNFAAVYGEDGKVGLLGRVVAKEGAILGRALLAGFMQGVGQILQQSATVVNISPVGGTTTASVKTGQALRYSLFGGASKAAEILAKEYERLIKITFPVIEINAGRKVDIVFYQMPHFKEVCIKCKRREE